MTDSTSSSGWSDKIINILSIVTPIIIVMIIGIMNIKSNQAVLANKMDDALIRQKGLEQNVSKILTEQSSMRTNLLNYTDRVKRLEDNTSIIGMMHQRIINNEGKILQIQADFANFRNEKLLRAIGVN